MNVVHFIQTLRTKHSTTVFIIFALFCIRLLRFTFLHIFLTFCKISQFLHNYVIAWEYWEYEWLFLPSFITFYIIFTRSAQFYSICLHFHSSFCIFSQLSAFWPLFPGHLSQQLRNFITDSQIHTFCKTSLFQYFKSVSLKLGFDPKLNSISWNKNPKHLINFSVPSFSVSFSLSHTHFLCLPLSSPLFWQTLAGKMHLLNSQALTLLQWVSRI
jgi:hypothetical protein